MTAPAGELARLRRREQAGQAAGETRAVRIIGVTFFALAAYLTAEVIRDLAWRWLGRRQPAFDRGAACLIQHPDPEARRTAGRAIREPAGGRAALAALTRWPHPGCVHGVRLVSGLSPLSGCPFVPH